ncbi:hypothetical protein [Pseudoflavonifractor sp. An85]|uniref:hypothetical protein n=1 Tax=Pseudoflavonifractor sp. An85 TaxID=1965661 RepID=UPI000B39E0F8|nr:hypothetical protein [Pseudoflavonifractor sp. An85]OUN26157.1 hypothetical protein B5G37_00025 [Pseudoflavonifractor sp. An85]
MKEQELEFLLYQQAYQLSPKDFSPWRRALKQVCWGLALWSITLDIFYLNYLLPTLGAILLWLGLRSLRRQNRPFHVGFVLSWVLSLYHVLIVAALATPATQNAPLLLGLRWFGSLITWGVYLCLWLGLRGVFRQAQLPPKNRAAGWLVVCYGLLMAMAFLSLNLLILVLPVLLVYIFLLVGLYRTHRSLDQAGYAVHPAPVRVSNGWAAATWLGLTVLAVVVPLSLSLRLPLQGAEPFTLNTQQSQVRGQLEQLGFPAELLVLLPDAQVAQLENATQVQVTTQTGSLEYADMSKLSMDIVEVALTQTGDIRVYAFFHWDSPPKQRMLEGLYLIPNIHELAVSLSIDQLQGMLFWEESGQTFQAPLGNLFTSPPEIQLTHASQGYSYADLTFSLPKDGEQIRGYVSWTLHGFTMATNLNAKVVYLHQESPLLYPCNTPGNQYFTNSWSSMGSAPFSALDRPLLIQYPDISS